MRNVVLSDVCSLRYPVLARSGPKLWDRRNTVVALKFVPLEAAREITGHCSNAALAKWIHRHNRKHPEALILKRSGHIETNSLQQALRVEVAEKTPGYGVAEGLAMHSANGGAV